MAVCEVGKVVAFGSCLVSDLTVLAIPTILLCCGSGLQADLVGHIGYKMVKKSGTFFKKKKSHQTSP